MRSLEVHSLTVSIGGKPILNNLSLNLPKGEVHAVMGPNGSGKSTLAKTLAGHGDYEVDSGTVVMDGEPLLGLEVDERARAGLFMAFQYPVEIPGVSIANFIRAALNARQGNRDSFDAIAYYRRLYGEMDRLGIDRKFSSRSVNEGFSGGEKKRCEILQMAMLEPEYCILDETDSGLDVDALKIVAAGVNQMRGDDRGILVITHYQRLLNHIVPDRVHIIVDGRIVKSGDKSLALEVEERGYDWIKEEMAAGV